MKKNYLLHLLSALSLIVFAFLFWGSASTKAVTGRPIDETKISQIKDGKTTMNEIIVLFGAPQNTSYIGDKTLYIYKYCISKGSGFSTGYTTSTSTTESCDELS